LKADADRHKLRVESLQKHIENYQAMGNSNVVEANEDVSNKSEHASTSLKQENEQLREYLT